MLRLDRTTYDCALVAVGLSLIVGLDGSIGWRALRIATVIGIGWAVTRLPDSRWPRAAWTVVVLAAFVAVAITGTIAVSYLTKSGWSGRGIAGLVGTAGAIGLLLVGFGEIIRSIRGRRRWLVVPAGLIAAFVVVSAIMPAVYAANVPRPRLGNARPSDRGLAYRDATFETADGLTLAGWYIPSTNRAAVVLLHGASSTRAAVLDQAAVLARHGYGVLLFDARGHGDSDGRAMEFGWHGDPDIAAAIDYLQRQPEIDPRRIGAVGMSMGGEEAIGAMASDARIRATVAEGATSRTSADKSWMADEYGWRGQAQLAIEWATYRLAGMLSAAATPITLHDAVRSAAPRPVLLIAAGTIHDEQLAGEYIRTAAPASVQLWIVDGAGHTGGLRTQPTEWDRRVTAFLDAALVG